MSLQHLSKPQPTLLGFSAWAFERLVKVKRQSAATVAAQIIEQWLDSSREELATLWNIRFEEWEKLLVEEAREEAEEKAKEEAREAREEALLDALVERLLKRLESEGRVLGASSGGPKRVAE